jgi:hypothetical protein
MINIDNNTQEKLKLIDSIIGELSIETIKSEYGLDLTAMVLRGDTNGPVGLIQQLVNELKYLQNQLYNEQANLIAIRNDLTSLIRCIKRGIGDPYVASEFTSLAQRNNVY